VTATVQEASASPGQTAVQPALASAASQGAETSAVPGRLPETVTQVVEHNDAALAAAEAPADGEEADDEELEGTPDADEGEAEETDANAVVPNGPIYTAELSDEQLTELWKKEPASLGSISVGFVESGRMVNAVRVPQPENNDWLVVSPELAWATQETVDYLSRAIREVRAQYPKAPPLRVNQLSSREGGYLRPHKSHQNGRDVDLGFYYPTAEPVRVRAREHHIDLELNWALLKALAIHTDVQMILLDKRVQKVLYDYALRKGENKEWVDSLFNAGAKSLVKHARGHRDHFHVRFFNPRAQELGRRIAPLLALQPDKNILVHRVRSGDTLGGIALRYGSLYGPGGATEPMIEMLRRRRLPAPRGGGGVTSLIYIDDAAAATVAALERGRSGEAYNVVDDEPVTWGRFFGALAKAFGTPPPREVPRWIFRFMPYAGAVMLGTYRLSNAKVERELGWTPTARTYREGIPQLLQALDTRG